MTPRKTNKPSKQPKGKKEYTVENGKRMVYTDLGNGNWQGNEVVKPKMAVVKKAPAYSTTKGKVTSRKWKAKKI
jgi:hypothetical protein